MAVNEWIHGYLEAILATGVTSIEDAGGVEVRLSPALIGFNTSKYFIEEVVAKVDETGLHQAWLKATSTKDSRERTARLENLCWRIWHLTRTKKQVELTADERSPDRLEKQKGIEDEAFDSGDESLESDTLPPSSEMQEMQHGDGQHKEKRRYIVMISLHGLVRGDNMELGRDSDTGGQVRYVVEFARALATMPDVYRVDLLTRQISSPEVDSSYAEPTEMIVACDEVGESSGAYIVRIPCGPTDKYLRKELLWPYVEEFVDRALAHITNMAKVLGEQINGGEPVWPYVVHGHYADAGHIAALISGTLNVPMVFTGHSLGRNKLDQLLKQGMQSRDDINATYKIMRRIEAEEFALDAAELVITSTKQEIGEQWGLYDGFDVELEKTLRIRARRGVSCHGRHMPRIAVIPPGVQMQQESFEAVDAAVDLSVPVRSVPIWDEVRKFLSNPHKPMILALARPDPKKNLTTLINAFGKSRALRELANMTLIMGNRDDIETMSGASANILTTVLKLIDKYDLYGLVAYPKHHKLSEVPDIYKLAAHTKGVFVNPALVEPFGLTLIEAADCGLPMVATKNGGPVDIQKSLNNGVLVDPHDEDAIVDALLKLLTDRTMWAEYRRNGLKNVHLYSWPEHCKKYLSQVAACRKRHPGWQRNSNIMEEESQSASLRDMSLLQLSDDSTSTSTDRLNEDVLRSSGLHHQHLAGLQASTKCPAMKKQLVVIAVDSYIGSKYTMVGAVREIILNATNEQSLVLSTALTESEVLELLTGDTCATKFDAFVCRSGAALFYPSLASASPKPSPSAPTQVQLVQDHEYEFRIDYNWSGDDIRKAMARILSSEGTAVEAVEDIKGSSRYCIAYDIALEKMHKVDEYRRLLRKRGLRCHVIGCRNNTKLHIVPVLTSRSQALRYFALRWGVDLPSATVFVGGSGDSDYGQLRRGSHKTVVV